MPETFREQLNAALDAHMRAGGTRPVVCIAGRLWYHGLAGELAETFRLMPGGIAASQQMLASAAVEIDGVAIHCSFTREDGFEVA